MPQILITGVRSCTGMHLVRFLASIGEGPIIGSGVSAVESIPGISNYIECDFGNAAAVSRLIEIVKPNIIFHLAGCSDEEDPEALIRTNIQGTWHLLDSCRRQKVLPSAILLVGSAAGYGPIVAGEESFREERTAHPASFYGFSREAELELGRLVFEKWQMPVFLCRVFNLIGPGLSERYAPAAILNRLLEAQRDKKSDLALRNGDVIRDFVDVRDVVRAYHLLVNKGKPGIVYNIGSGVGITVKQLARQLANLAGVPNLDFTDGLVTKPERAPAPHSVANVDRIARETGWHAEIPLEASLRDMSRHTVGLRSSAGATII